ncbi:MAG: hypothetical protein JWM59_876 [Verrucomicrobiales bacterium]|nr:hypothetical protein [Verrucomicrobiales bacterium]
MISALSSWRALPALRLGSAETPASGEGNSARTKLSASSAEQFLGLITAFEKAVIIPGITPPARSGESRATLEHPAPQQARDATGEQESGLPGQEARAEPWNADAGWKSPDLKSSPRINKVWRAEDCRCTPFISRPAGRRKKTLQKIRCRFPSPARYTAGLDRSGNLSCLDKTLQNWKQPYKHCG